nr:accessory gland peptide [Musca domestica]
LLNALPLDALSSLTG